MASNVPIYDSFVQDGAAVVLLADATTGRLTEIGRCNGIELDCTVNKISATKVLRSRIHEMNEHVKSDQGMLRFNQMEWGPDAAQIIFGSSDDVQTVENNTRCVARTWRRRLYDEAQIPAIDDVGFATLAWNAPITSVTPNVTVTGGGGWTTGANTFVVVPLYASDKTNGVRLVADDAAFTTYADLLDINSLTAVDGTFTAGTPVQANATFANADDKVSIDVVQAALGDDDPTVDGWAVFSIAGSSALATTTRLRRIVANTVARSGGTQAITVLSIAAQGSNSLYVASIRASVRNESDWSTGTTTYTKLTEGTDFEWDEATGLISRIDGGAIANGEMVEITVWVNEPPYVQNDIMRNLRNTDYRIIEVWSTHADDNPLTNERTQIQGFMYRLEKVQTAGIAAKLTSDEENFMPAVPVECKALSGSNNRYGYHRHFSRRHDAYAQAIN